MRISRHFLFCVNEEEILKIVNICKPYPGVVSRLQDSLVRTTFCACHFRFDTSLKYEAGKFSKITDNVTNFFMFSDDQITLFIMDCGLAFSFHFKYFT